MDDIFLKIKNNENLCHCNKVSFQDILNENGLNVPQYEIYLKNNNIGNKCTSCLPEAEILYNYIYQNKEKIEPFIKLKKHTPNNNQKYKFNQKIKKLKENIYEIIDFILPKKVPVLKAYIPVISSNKIQSYIVNGNFSYPFNSNKTKTKLINIKVYDEKGSIFWKIKKRLKPNDMMRLPIPKYNNENISVGYAEINSKFLEKGDRGTSRIHLNVISDSSISQVHSGSPSHIKELYIDYIDNKESNEKVSLIISNVYNKKNHIKIFDKNNEILNMTLGPNQSHFVQLPKKNNYIYYDNESNIKTVRLESSAYTGLIHFFYSLNENSFSVDHLDANQYTVLKHNQKILKMLK